jgi:ABC-2 type transport system permease protein
VLWSQLIFLPSMLIGGLMMPLSILPASIRPISGLLPTSYAMQAYQGLAFHSEAVFNPWISAAVLAAGGLVAFALAIYLFRWDSTNSARRGNALLALLAIIPYIAGILFA